MDLPVESPVRLNIGCGKRRIEGYIGVDLGGDADVIADIKELPFADSSADEIMGIHVFEHLYRWEALPALQEWFRVLKKGGRLVLEMPDIRKVAHFILNSEDVRMGLWGAFGDPGYQDPLMVHRWGWSFEELSKELKVAGFRKITPCNVQFHKRMRDMRVEAIKP